MDHNRDMRRRRRRKAQCNRKRLARSVGERPRLAVSRSLKNISAQIIDDLAGRTLAAASSRETSVTGPDEGGKKGMAAAVGAVLAERAKAAGVTKVVFDRRHYKYHGRVKALADAAREGGLDF